MSEATLVLEDGSVFTGKAFGAAADAVFELVFNTSMTGYQEIITDPSYRGQGVVFTVPHIGNVGVNLEDDEAAAPQVSAVVVRAVSPFISNWRAAQSLPGWLAQHRVPGISEVDTRSITRKLRQQGNLKAAISTRGTSPEALLKNVRDWPGLDGIDMVSAVTCPEPYSWSADPAEDWVNKDVAEFQIPAWKRLPLVVLVDYGAKRNIARHLAAWGARVMVAPAHTSAQEVLAYQPDGVLLSNGPGDPQGLPYAVQAVSELVASGVPVFGICLGHQLLGLALGGRTGRLKFGHHGGNHPVKELKTGKVSITAQNHNYIVLQESLDQSQTEITHISLFDQSVEGFRLLHQPVFSVQFHPEAAPGPHDAHQLFGQFFKAIAQRGLA